MNEDTTPAETDQTPGFQPDPEPRRGWRDRFRRSGDRVAGVRGAIAVGLAGLVIGGAGGFALHAAVDHHDGPGRFERDFRGDFREHGVPPGGAPGGVPGGGQLPPATSPDDQQQEDYSGGSNS